MKNDSPAFTVRGGWPSTSRSSCPSNTMLSSSPGCVCLPTAPPGSNSALACTAWRPGMLKSRSCTGMRLKPGACAFRTPAARTAARPATIKTLLFMSTPPWFLGTQRILRSAARGRCLLGREIQLHLRAAGIVAEDLPDTRAYLLAKGVLDAVRLEPSHRSLEVARGEREVVEHAGRISGQLCLGNVQDRLAAGVHPRAAEAQGGPGTLGEAEHADVEGTRLFQLVGQHIE